MFTIDTVLESLKSFDIDEPTVRSWESQLGLNVPMDEYGRKTYSPHHINLFKNIKKHLTLGRSLEEIKKIITLPPAAESKPRRVMTPMESLIEPLMGHQEGSDESVASAGHSRTATQERIPDQRPEMSESQSQQQAGSYSARRPAIPKQYASSPQQPALQHPIAISAPIVPQAGRGSDFIQLVDKLIADKDLLQRKMVETEKLNSHLYNANNMFHRKVKELNEQIRDLKERLKEDYQIKLLNDKDKLHKQLIAIERNYHHKEKEIEKTVQEKDQVIEQKNQVIDQRNEVIEEKNQEIQAVQQQIKALEKHLQDKAQLVQEKEEEMMLRLQEKDLEAAHQMAEKIEEMNRPFDPASFRGDWEEVGELLEILYDNFGINVEPRRHRIFRISDAPERAYGKTAVINTQYEYESNTLWMRYESLVATYVNDRELEGELSSEYVIDGVPVAKAVYRIHCKRVDSGR